MSARETVVVCDLGHAAYRPTWELQRRVQSALISAKRSTPPRGVPHVLLLVEHPPVYTLGKSGDAGHLLASDELLRQRGASFVEIDRGGDITFHGPGQIVGYPILDLDRFYTDVHRYLRELEETIIRTIGAYGLKGRRSENRTGVWIGPDESGKERKICAMGIRCSRWVTMHGFALNVNTDLSYFSHIVPCGISDRGVTSMREEMGREIDLSPVKTRLARDFANLFDVDLQQLSGREAATYLDALSRPHHAPAG